MLQAEVVEGTALEMIAIREHSDFFCLEEKSK